MHANLVTGHGKALLQMSLANDEYQREVVSALDVEGSRTLLTLGVTVVIVVIVVAVELGTSKAMGKCETSEIGIAKVHLRRLCRLDQQLEVSIVP